VIIKRNLCKNLVFNGRSMFYFVTVKVLFILTRIILFMVDLGILMCNIIRFVVLWTLDYWSLKRFIEMTMVLI